MIHGLDIRANDWTNSRVGKMTVLGPHLDKFGVLCIRPGTNCVEWDCRCDCGNVEVRASAALRRGEAGKVVTMCTTCRKRAAAEGFRAVRGNWIARPHLRRRV